MPHDVHILRPSGFEFAGQLQQAILDAVPENIKAIRKDLAFVDFDGIEAYAAKHPRAARYLASIRAQEETNEHRQVAAQETLQADRRRALRIEGQVDGRRWPRNGLPRGPRPATVRDQPR